MSEENTNKVEEQAAAPVAEVQNTQEFLDTFDWHKYEEGIEAVDQSKLDAFDKALEGTVGFVNERDVIEGTVVRKTDRDVIIDLSLIHI